MLQDIQPHKYTVSYKNSKPNNGDILLIYTDKGMLYKKSEGFWNVGDFNDDVKRNVFYLFSIDDNDYYTTFECANPVTNNSEVTYVPNRELRYIRPLWHCFAAMLGLHLNNWYSNNKYCGRCGSKNDMHNIERALACPECGHLTYPQICPSVIVGVICNDKLLLTKYAISHNRHKNYALVAGYNEIGETMEDTVRREVMEEVGLKVKNIKYYASQPWPLTGSLLLGYFCEVDGCSDVKIDYNELSVAQWHTADEIPEDSADGTISLTGTMIRAFKNGFRI